MRKMLFGLLCVILAMTVLVSCAPSATPTPAPAPQTATPARPITPKPTEEAVKPKPATSTPEPPKPAGAPYYQGKTIEILVGESPGGGTDTMARIIAPFLTKYVPGSPRIIIRNQPGAAGANVNNTFFGRTKPDGFTILEGASSAITMQLNALDIVSYDLKKYRMIGSISRGGVVLMIRKGLRATLTDPKAPPLVVGTKQGEETWQGMVLWGKEFLGWNLRWVVGYGATAEMELAFRRNELDVFGTSNSYMINNLGQEGFSENLCQAGTLKGSTFVRRSDYPEIPTFEEVLGDKKPSGALWQAYLVFVGPISLDKFLAAPPATPDNIVSILIDAYAKMAKDPQFDQTVKKMVSEVYDVGIGKEVEVAMNQVLDVPPGVLDYLKDLQKKAGLK